MPPRFRSAFVLPLAGLHTSILTLLCLLTISSLDAPAVSQTPAAIAPATSPNRPILRIGSQGEAVTELQAMLKLLGYYRDAVNGNYQQSTAEAVSAFQQSIGLTADGIAGPETWNRLLPPSPSASTTASTSPTPAPAPTPTPTPAPTPTSTPTPAPAPTPTPAPAPAPAPTRPTTPAPTPPANSGATSNPASIDLPTLRPGMRGSAIELLQERLRSLEFYDGEIDGIFGPQTQAAVEAAQRNFGLEPDGIVGPATWGALLR